MLKFEADQPLYTIGVVADLIGVHPETLRVWERNGLIKPARSNKQRLYSNSDLKRLRFINDLIETKGLNLAGVKQMIQLYPCWWLKNCEGPGDLRERETVNYAKMCWKEIGSYCIVMEDKADYCSTCEYCPKQKVDVDFSEVFWMSKKKVAIIGYGNVDRFAVEAV